MRWRTFHLRSLVFHWKSHLWVALSVAVAAAVLTGALIVGDSMRGSLRELALGRLGTIDYAISAPRLFRDDLSLRVREHVPQVRTATVLMVRAAVTHAHSRLRVGKVIVAGVDETFWELDTEKLPPAPSSLNRRSIFLNEPLANELGAVPGDEVVLHLGKLEAISTETLLGRRDETTATLRLTVRAVLPPRGLAIFDLSPTQGFSQNAFVPLETLQRALGQEGKANTLLADGSGSGEKETSLQTAIQYVASLGDVGLKMKTAGEGAIKLESDSLLIEPRVEEAILQTAKSIRGAETSRFLAYLANTIRRLEKNNDASQSTIPYSTIVAVDPGSQWMQALRRDSDQERLDLADGGIILNQWAADDLGAAVGDSVEISFYVTLPSGELETRSAVFSVQGIVPMRGMAADPALVPQYKGVTDAESLADWDPPFPLDLKLIRDKDEAYWKESRTTPKAFITLADGRRLWTQNAERLGSTTSIRVHRASYAAEDLTADFSTAWGSQVDYSELGLRAEPVRAQMAKAASGPTDFGVLFLSFSAFIIVSAAMLIGLLFRLGVEKRAFEIGLMLATGFTPRRIAAAILLEGLSIATVGTALGLGGAVGFAWLMLAGLRTWWSAAVNSPLLGLHLQPLTLVIGGAVSLLVSAGVLLWTVRGAARRSPHLLLAGEFSQEILPLRKARSFQWTIIVVCVLLIVVSLGGAGAAEAATRAMLFFASGSAALCALIAAASQWLRRDGDRPIVRPGTSALVRLGMRSARRNPRRSLLTIGLIATAAFLIVSLEAFRLAPDESENRSSGVGGFALYAESAAPLPYDPATPVGRSRLGLESTGASTGSTGPWHIQSFRLRPGDESSCTNLYRPSRPRILGAPSAFIERGGFIFADHLSGNRALDNENRESLNPWSLLHEEFPDGAVPAIADANPVQWQFQLGLGRDLVIEDESGRPVRLRFVALLKNSVLQDEIVIAEESFTRLFPSISGRSFFLVDAPPQQASTVEQYLERELEPFGFDAATTRSRLQKYFAVQNTYISTFQTLGGLGLLLGAAGLAAVLTRNVWERRRELALMRTTGFSRRSLAVFVLAENVALVMAGLAAGVGSALLAIAPMMTTTESQLPGLRLAGILIAVLLVGLLAGLVAVFRALQAPLIPALRSE